MTQQQFTEEVLAAEKQLYGVAKSILQNDADCEDAVQNALLNAYAHLGTLRNEEFFATWLTRILINECYRLIRKEKKNTVSYDELPEKTMAAANAENGYSDIYMALMDLKGTYRLPFVLYYVEGYSIKETADILQIPENTIKQRLFRARRHLRKLLGGELGYEG